jgi:hypothetical protein
MQYVEKIGCFFIIAKIFLHFCPNEAYEKYVGALVQWIALALFLLPLLSETEFEQALTRWQSEFEESMNVPFAQTVEEFDGQREEMMEEWAKELLSDRQEENKENEEE